MYSSLYLAIVSLASFRCRTCSVAVYTDATRARSIQTAGARTRQGLASSMPELMETPARAIIRFDCSVAGRRGDLGQEQANASAIGSDMPQMSKKIAFFALIFACSRLGGRRERRHRGSWPVIVFGQTVRRPRRALFANQPAESPPGCRSIGKTCSGSLAQ